MSFDNFGWETSLSLVGNEQTKTIRSRQGVTLLRPVFMNAVEVGYSYAHCDREKKLNVRGVTIALWYFICRGHQAIALLPYCFKNYAEKSSRYSELMMLYRLNLIEFTPGYGSEKYTEVNRIMVNRAFETGGCIVARSQMQGITDNKINLINVVEQRLLMPTFNGDDIMFPIDGPLGRNGPTLKQTLECEQGSSDWRNCSEHQLLYSDQKHWLEKLALLVPEKGCWSRMSQLVQNGIDNVSKGGDQLQEYSQAVVIPMHHQQVSENPFNRNFNHYSTNPVPIPRITKVPNPVVRKISPPASISNQRISNHISSGSRESVGRHRSSKNSATTGSIVSSDSSQSCGSRGHVVECSSEELNASPDVRTSGTFDEMVATEIPIELMDQLREDEEWVKKEAEQRKNDEQLAKLSQIFGYSKSSRVMDKFKHIRNFAQLVEKCIHEKDQEGDEMEFVVPRDADADDVADLDLIDFSTNIVDYDPVETNHDHQENLIDLLL